jgi:P27 family predicted phage terminase small subunit
MASPKPRPTRLKLIEGRGEGRDSGGRKVKQTPGFVRLPPDPPEWLPAEARAEWDRIVPELQRLELLKPIDRSSLTAYCMSWQRFFDACKDIAEGKVTTRGSQGQLVKHPSVMVAESASKELRAWAGEFGLTPSAEQRLAGFGADNAAADENPFSGLASASG